MITNQTTYLNIVLFLFLYTLGSSILWSQTNKNTTELLFKQREYDSVISILTKKQASNELSFKEYFWLSRSYGRTRQFGNGYVLSSEMIQKASEKKDAANLLKAFNLKAEHLIDLYRIDEGVKFCDSITPFFKKKDSIEFMKLCFKCGMLYHHNLQGQKAYNSYKKITKKEYQNLSIYSNNFAIILLQLKKYDEAIFYLKKSLESHRNRQEKYYADLNVKYNNIGSAYTKKGDWKLAKIYLDSAYNNLSPDSRLTSKRGIFENFYTLHKLNGNTNIAISSLDSIYQINEALLQKRIKEKILSIEAANKNENRLIKKVKYIDDKLTESKSEILKGTLALFTLIFILIIAVLFFKYRIMQSSYKNVLMNQRLNWTKLKPEYLSDSLLTMKGMINNKNPKSVQYISKFSKLLRLILESSRKPLILLIDEINTIKYYLEIQQLEVENSFDYKIHINNELKDKDIYIPPMLVQPFIEQAIINCNTKETENPIIEIKLSYFKETLNCVITDNGIESKENEKQLLEKKIDTYIKSKELLKIFSKRLNIASDLHIENVNSGYAGNKITLILPHKNEEL